MTSSHEPYYLLNSSVKGLTRIQGATTLPSIYITRSPVAAKSELVVKEEIPKIDLSLLRNGAPDDRSRIIRDIGRACKDWGCFIIVNHGIPEKLQRAMIEAFAGFFNLTEQEKEVYTVKNNFESVRHGTSINLRLDDVRFWRDFLTISVYPVFHFPDKPMDFRFRWIFRDLGPYISPTVIESSLKARWNWQEELHMSLFFHLELELCERVEGVEEVASTMASVTSYIQSTPFSRRYLCLREFRGLKFSSQPSISLKTSNFSATIKSSSVFALLSDDNVKDRSNRILSYSNGATNVYNSILIEKGASDDTVVTGGFFEYEVDQDLDSPTKGFSSVSDAVEDIRQGKLVIVVDDEDRENEGDLIMAASKVTSEAMAFIVRHGTGIVCVSMKGEDLERLQLPQMVIHRDNEEKLRTAFTVSVDAKEGTTTGVSAKDRATTILALSSPHSKCEDFNRPGHIFPLKYREGGVLKRAGHTEASVDLAVLAGLSPAAVLCEIVDDDDGSMARLPKLREFAKKKNLKIISIADLIRYRRKRDKLVERASVARLPLSWGTFQAYCYRSLVDGMEHIAMVKGDIGDGQDILVRVHSECLTGDIFGSARCDCGSQLEMAMKQIEQVGRGVVVYLRGHEGRGIGLGHKLRAYNLQDNGRDTVEANEELGLPVDSREYGIGAQILQDLGVRTMRLITNNPAKYCGLKGYGLSIVEKVTLPTLITKENKKYLETKRIKMGHVYGSEFNGQDINQQHVS